MRIGFNLPQSGPDAGPDAIARVATRAEELGYDSVWVWERLLFPTSPQTPYGGTPDGSYPDAFKRHLDPLAALTFAAAHTSRVALGTSVLDMPFYNPVMLARELTALDVLSNGRLRVGLGLGWSQDEFDATNAPPKGKGRFADEFVTVLKTIWTTEPVEHKGEFFRIPKSSIQPKPVQQPHPPILLAAYSEAGLKRAATLADGWTPVGIPLDGMKQMIGGLRGMNPKAQVYVRANVHVTDDATGSERFIFYGSLDEIKADVEACRDLGVDELFYDVSFSPDGARLDGYLTRMEQLRELAG